MRHFAEFFDTRRMFTETETTQLYGKDEETRVFQAFKLLPDHCSYFRLFDIPNEVPVPAPSAGVEFRPVYNRVYESGHYFPDGRLYSFEDINAMAEADAHYVILRSNMRSNKWPKVVQHRGGGFQPFDPAKDRII